MEPECIAITRWDINAEHAVVTLPQEGDVGLMQPVLFQQELGQLFVLSREGCRVRL